MLADFFTKPLQGNLFRKFRDVILGYKHVDTLKMTIPSSNEERVEDKRPDDGKAIISVNDIYDKSSTDVKRKTKNPQNDKKDIMG